MTAPAVASELPLDATASWPELRRRTWSLAWPVIFSFSIEALVGLFDILMVGRLGATAVAGVGVGIQVMGAVDATLFAVGTGALAIVARHIGAGDRRAADETLRQSIVAAAALSILAAVPVFLAAPAIIRAFHVDEAVVAAGTPFLRTVMLGVPAAAVLFVVVATLRGAGDTRTPLAVGAVVGTANVGLAYVLIFGRLGLPALGVAGAATATVLAFTIGATLGVTLLLRGGLVLRLRLRPLRLRPDVIRRVLDIGVPAALEHLLMQVGFFIYIVFAAHHGTAPVAAYFIGARILSLSFLPGFGFGAAAATMVGQSLGAGRPDDAERSGGAAVRLALGLMTAAGAVVFVAARPIARLFVDDDAVVENAFGFIRVLATVQPLMAIDFSLGGALRGAGDTRYPLLTVILGFYVCRLGFAYLVTFTLGLGVLWLWLAVLGDYAARATLKARRFRSGAWKLVRV
ncbi:MAG TPA: MATE family efflux transporter [Candidatus Binatia bacterium]|nr:MATE family efflux transporter [Candidatus Binatia bacterium]